MSPQILISPVSILTRTGTLAINADPGHKHAHNKAERVERVRVKEIEISVVTAGQFETFR